MFDLVEITLINFRSFRDTHTFKFPTEPGLYSLTGQNLKNPRMGSNGAGKSTFLDAIYWALYGATTRGLKGSGVIHWEEKTCTVELTLIVGNKQSIVKRTQAPNNLTLDGVTVSQEQLQKYLRLSPDAFTYAVLIPQFGEAFFDRSASSKLMLFTQVMELDSWLERSKLAATLASEIATNQIEAEGKLTTCRTLIDNTTSEVTDLTKDSDNFNKGKSARIKILHEELNAATKEQHHLIEKLHGIRNVLAKQTIKIEALDGKAQVCAQALKRLQGEREAALTAKATAQAGSRALRGQIKALTGLTGTCPTCLQPIDPSHLKAEAKKLAKQEEAFAVDLDDADYDLDSIKLETDEQNKTAHALQVDLHSLQTNKSDFESEQTKQSNKLATIDAVVTNLKHSVKQEQDAVNPYTKQIKAKEASLAKLRDQLEALKAELTILTEDHAAVSYWVNGFKRVRLLIIDETLQQLEIEVNNNLTALGLLDWRVAFDVERENKSGGITKGFVVLIHAPGHTEPVRWEAWSGGETQRLRLAGDLGLANLIMHRAGLTSAIEFFDEPSRHLSQEGVLDLAEALYQRAITSDKRIYLVDHSNIDFGDFAGQITAVKDHNSSHLLLGPSTAS